MGPGSQEDSYLPDCGERAEAKLVAVMAGSGSP